MRSKYWLLDAKSGQGLVGSGRVVTKEDSLVARVWALDYVITMDRVEGFTISNDSERIHLPKNPWLWDIDPGKELKLSKNF